MGTSDKTLRAKDFITVEQTETLMAALLDQVRRETVQAINGGLLKHDQRYHVAQRDTERATVGEIDPPAILILALSQVADNCERWIANHGWGERRNESETALKIVRAHTEALREIRRALHNTAGEAVDLGAELIVPDSRLVGLNGEPL